MLDVITEAHRHYVNGDDKFMVFNILLENLLNTTCSEYGFIGEILYKDEIPFLRTYAITNIGWTDELHKRYNKHNDVGWDFLSLDTLFGLVITENSIIISNDPANDPRRGASLKTPKGHPPLNSFAGIPFYHNKKIIGMVGLANKSDGYSIEEVKKLNPLFDTCSTLISSYKIQDNYKNLETQSHIFMSQASHDMRTPLNGIFGYCQLIEQVIEKEDDIYDYVSSIKNCSERLLGLIDDILCISKTVIDVHIENLTLLDFILDMNKMVTPMASKNNIKVQIRDIENVEIQVDKKIIDTVFSNLLTNAIKYNKNNGEVVISSKIIDDKYINIDISDTGLGMEKSDLDNIFEPFFRCKTTSHIQGSGIGLSIVKKYIASINGEISVKSDKGVGSVFSIKLEYKHPRNEKILYVEDDITNTSLMKIIMKKNKIPLDISRNISNAKEKIHKNKYCVFILDLNLPDGEGVDLIPYIKDKERIIILTADASISTSKKVHDLGLKNFILKPFNINELLSLIKNIM